MGISLAAELECSTIEGWFWVTDPLSNWQVYRVLTDGLLAAKAEYRAALAAHDHDQAAALLAEVTDLSALCAAAADQLAMQRARFMAHGHRWPLGCLA